MSDQLRVVRVREMSKGPMCCRTRLESGDGVETALCSTNSASTRKSSRVIAAWARSLVIVRPADG